jgi:hypothetical protein
MGDGSMLDGVTVTKAKLSGYGRVWQRSQFSLSHCVVKDNFGYGIYSKNCDTEIRWTTINGNGTTGLHHEGEGYDLKVDTSWLLRNGAYRNSLRRLNSHNQEFDCQRILDERTGDEKLLIYRIRNISRSFTI